MTRCMRLARQRRGRRINNRVCWNVGPRLEEGGENSREASTTVNRLRKKERKKRERKVTRQDEERKGDYLEKKGYDLC